MWLCCVGTELLLEKLQLQQLVQGLQRGLIRARHKGLGGLGWWMLVILLGCVVNSGRSCNLPLSLVLALRKLYQ